jgi:hypothetical protein
LRTFSELFTFLGVSVIESLIPRQFLNRIPKIVFFSVFYAETINRKTEYTLEDGCALSITEKVFQFRKVVGSDSKVGILNPTNIFLNIRSFYVHK